MADKVVTGGRSTAVGPGSYVRHSPPFLALHYHYHSPIIHDHSACYAHESLNRMC
jgi:hypothetical protein